MIQDRHLTDFLSLQEVPLYKLLKKTRQSADLKNALGKVTVFLEYP